MQFLKLHEDNKLCPRQKIDTKGKDDKNKEHYIWIGETYYLHRKTMKYYTMQDSLINSYQKVLCEKKLKIRSDSSLKYQENFYGIWNAHQNIWRV